MDRFAAMIILLGVLVSMVLLLLAVFSLAPVTCSCMVLLFYSVYLFMAYEESGVHQAQEFENRYWTGFGLFLGTALFFSADSPVCIGLWNPTVGIVCVILAGYVMHLWDRYSHRIAISRTTNLRKSISASKSLRRLQDLGIPVEDQVGKINECLQDIDQLLIPSTVNNFINRRFVMSKEREIITIFETCDARALNYIIRHVKLGLLFYKIKDHATFNGKNRTEFINLVAVTRLPILTTVSRVIVLHSLQLLKLKANRRAEFWVSNILLNTHQDHLSELKTLMDSKGDYFCMNKLIFDDIKSESIRQEILNHFRREAAFQQTHMQMGTRRPYIQRGSMGNIFHPKMIQQQWRKVLSDVDDTLCCSGGSYPAGIDKRYPKKVVYPGVLAFYRELDLGTRGPEEWQDEHIGNLVFLSARPHLYKDISEKANFAKFEKLRTPGGDGRQRLHTTPSLLAGDLTSGGQYIYSNDFEPLARKKFDNFRRYVAIYPEYQHVFVCDNGQGDVRAGEMMFDSFPYEFEALYVHQVIPLRRTHGYSPERWREKEFQPYFFQTYPEAALHAATRHPPLIRIKGLQRICNDSVKDFCDIKNWSSETLRAVRRMELNQAIWRANQFLIQQDEYPADLIRADPRYFDGEKVRTPYGIGKVCGFDPVFDLYDIELDWRPLDVQVAEHNAELKAGSIRPKQTLNVASTHRSSLPTVVEADEADDEFGGERNYGSASTATLSSPPSTPSREGNSSYTQEVGQSSAEVPNTKSVKTASLPPIPPGPGTPQRSISMPPTLPSTPPPLTRNDSGDTSVASVASLPEQAAVASPVPAVIADVDIKPIFRVHARIRGPCISKYTPPVLPKIKESRGALFPFLQSSSSSSSSGTETPKPPPFKKGEQCNTPFGPGKVVEYRQKGGIVEVEMINWHATAYLQEKDVKLVPKSLLKSLIRQLSSSEKEKPLEFPHAEGTLITTPFGKAKVVKPLPVARSNAKRSPSFRPQPTLGLSLVGWTLADGSHPTVYCTEANARAWKDRKLDSSTSFLSTLGTLVGESTRTFLEPFLVPKNPPTAAVLEPPKLLFARYYKDAAAVTTPFGSGVVRSFREEDGFYEVTLTQWKLANDTHPTAYLRRETLGHRVAKGCHEGYPVLTSLGLSGILASVEPTTGVHIVTIPYCCTVCYLQPECVIQPLKACVGEDVLTQYGEGKVERYECFPRDVYTIRLTGWNATLYAVGGDTFDRVGDRTQEQDGSFGVSWLLQFLFFNNRPSVTSTPQRSRSNSVVSVTGSQSGRSLG